MMLRNKVSALLLFMTVWCSVVAAQPVLGRQTFGYQGVPHIRADTPFRGAARAVGRMGFLMRNGGVAFGAVAVVDGPEPTTVGLRYDGRYPDGDRIRVVLDGDDVSLGMADWLAVPTARWASQDTIELVTAFGRLKKSTASTACMKVFNYAKAFDGTLAGLRLMQADLVAMSPSYGDLFSDRGAYILGEGESEPSATELDARASLWHATVSEIGFPFQSYVWTDLEGKISFSAADGHIEFTGGPIVRLWAPASALGDSPMQAMRAEIAGMSDDEVTRSLELRLPELRGRIDSLDIPGKRADLKKLQELESLLAAGAGSPDDRRRVLVAVSMQLTELEPIFAPDADNPLSDPALLERLNPEVYVVARSVSRAAALYRYIRTRDPRAWRRFVRTLPTAKKVGPRVKLPTTMSVPCETEDAQPNSSDN